MNLKPKHLNKPAQDIYTVTVTYKEKSGFPPGQEMTKQLGVYSTLMKARQELTYYRRTGNYRDGRYFIASYTINITRNKDKDYFYTEDKKLIPATDLAKELLSYKTE